MVTLYLIVISSFILIISHQQSVTYELILSQRQPQFETHYHLSLLSKELFCIGTPLQCIKMQFDPGFSLPIILPSKHSDKPLDDDTAFQINKSSTFTIEEKHLTEYSGQKLIVGQHSVEKIQFGPLKLDRWHFYLANNWINELHYSSIGLAVSKLVYEEFYYFINELKIASLISTRQYAIELIDNTTAQITFGDIDIGNDYIKLFDIDYYSSYHINRMYPVSNLFLEATPMIVLVDNIDVAFDESLGVIQMPYGIMKQIEESLLIHLKCNKQRYNPGRRFEFVTVYYYMCLKEGLENVNDLSYDFPNGKLTLKKEDMLIDFNGNEDKGNNELKLFAIVFKKDQDEPYWVIGEPMLKHLMLVKNFENEVVTIYQKTGKAKGNKDSLRSLYCSVYIISSILLALGVIIIAGSNYFWLNKRK